MKKITLLLFFVLCSAMTFAQNKKPYLGLNVAYGTDAGNVGLGVKGGVFFTSQLRGEFSANGFFSNGNYSMWDLNLNAHYLFPVADHIYVYPLAGLTYMSVTNIYEPLSSAKGSDALDKTSDGSVQRVGVNVGAGVEWQFAKHFTLNGEAKYQLVKDFDQAVFHIGVAYHF